MPKAKLISPATRQSVKRLRVAAYCRVSSGSADQLNSYATQIRVYQKMIAQKPEWELVDIFADEGISGTKASNREDFQRMIARCERHEIDLIITKSVSRFARNVKDALVYVRKLKLLGIGVMFEKEGINTLSLGDEMLLNTFSAIAQEESQAISQNRRFSISKKMACGEFVDSKAPYGYRIKNGQLTIYEPEAQIIRSIFKMYLNGMSAGEISKALAQDGIGSKSGKVWQANHITYLLGNEKYVGDSLYQKYRRDATVPFREYRNKGEIDQYYAEDTHPAIVDRSTFDNVQQLLTKRQKAIEKKTEYTVYPLTSRIRCSECGSFYRRKLRTGCVKWVCTRHEEDASSCNSGYYSEDRIYDGLLSLFNKLRFGEEDILGTVITKLEEVTNAYKSRNQAAGQISTNIATVNANILMLQQMNAKGYLKPEVYQSQLRELEAKVRRMKENRQETLHSRIPETLEQVRHLKKLLDEIEEPLTAFDETLFRETVTGISINRHDEMTVTLTGGLHFTERI